MDRELENLSDGELFKLLNSDEGTAGKAFEEIYTRYSPRVYAYCRRFLNNRDNAEDIFQETWIRFYNSRLQPREMTNLAAFLVKIARNLCVNSVRSTKRMVSYDDAMTGMADNRNDDDELLNLVKMAIELLPEDYKDMFILREYDGLKYAEIAELTNLSVNTVKVKIHRAKEKIREILQPYLSEMLK